MLFPDNDMGTGLTKYSIHVYRQTTQNQGGGGAEPKPNNYLLREYVGEGGNLKHCGQMLT